MIIIIAIIIIFFILIYKNKKYTNKIQIYYFYAEWCHHCQEFKSEWNKFLKLIENDKNIVVTTINNCDKQELCNKFNIISYPSIISVNNNVTNIYTKERKATILYNYIMDLKKII